MLGNEKRPNAQLGEARGKKRRSVIDVMHVNDISVSYQPGKSPHRTHAPYRKRDAPPVLKTVPRWDADHCVPVDLFPPSARSAAAACDNGDLITEFCQSPCLLADQDLDAANMRLGVGRYDQYPQGHSLFHYSQIFQLRRDDVIWQVHG
jgi:hypothetical protein